MDFNPRLIFDYRSASPSTDNPLEFLRPPSPTPIPIPPVTRAFSGIYQPGLDRKWGSVRAASSRSSWKVGVAVIEVVLVR